MDDANPQNGSSSDTPPDPSGGTPPDTPLGPSGRSPPDPSGGGPPPPKETSGTEEEPIDGGKSVPVINPPIAYHSKGRMADLPEDTIKAVDSIVVPNGHRKGGALERSFLYSYSLAVCVVPLDKND